MIKYIFPLFLFVGRKEVYLMNPNGHKARRITYKKVRKNLYAISGGVCPVCGEKIQNKNPSDRKTYMTVDHIIPKSKGGTRKIYNIRPMCAKCNRLRGTIDTRYLSDYRSFINGNVKPATIGKY